MARWGRFPGHVLKVYEAATLIKLSGPGSGKCVDRWPSGNHMDLTLGSVMEERLSMSENKYIHEYR